MKMPDVGRVLMVAPPDDWRQRDLAWLDALQPAGVILFERHLADDAESSRRAIGKLHAWAAARGENLLVAMDEEGGFVTQTSRFFSPPPSPRVMSLGGSAETTREIYSRHGRRLAALGVNLDFAPVADVNNNPRNPVIGVRSFGGDVDTVVAHAGAACQGLQRAGILPTLKHFPGHGDTDVDSHLDLPIVEHDRPRFDAVELVPFRKLHAEVPVMMIAHLACPGIGDDKLPASLSARITTQLLRKEIGFRGVTITDSMEMQGVAAQFGYAEAAVRALGAGCDLLLYCFDLAYPEEARQGLSRALRDGSLSRERFLQAVHRVDTLRRRCLPGSQEFSGSLAGTESADSKDDSSQDQSPGVSPEARRSSQGMDLYRRVCRAALRSQGQRAWEGLRQAWSRGEHLYLAGEDGDLLERLRQRFAAKGERIEVATLAGLLESQARRGWVVLAERRPLEGDKLALFEEVARRLPGFVLLNLLTPEVDEALEGYESRLRCADTSEAMLEALGEFLRQRLASG